jgi:lysophospholipase
MGTSSTLFSGALVQLTAANASSIIVDAIQSLLSSISDQENDIAAYPNPFAGWNNTPVADFSQLTLVDAGLTNQNIPIEPLIIPYREVDAIIAFDSSADTTYSWPNGSALRTTFERAEVLAQTQDVSIRMPRVPSVNGFVNGGLNQRPVFFGCDANNTTPIVVYVPNYPWSYYANVSTVSPTMTALTSTNSPTKKPRRWQSWTMVKGH